MKTKLPSICLSKLNYRQACPCKKIAYSLPSRIDYDAFLSEMFSLPLFTDTTDNIDELLSQYNDGLSILLETHNPVLKKSIVSRPPNPWLTDNVLAARREARTLERLWPTRRNVALILSLIANLCWPPSKKAQAVG